jgi:hypothetical protein
MPPWMDRPVPRQDSFTNAELASRARTLKGALQTRNGILRANAARLAANPEYQSEIRAVRGELDELRAW